MYIDEVVSAQKKGEARGIYSVCSAHPTVVRASLAHALENGTYALVESTCNQVNQFGGYTGMRPGDFRSFLGEMARRLDFPPERLILGGDHLGPEVWQDEPVEIAMAKACVLVRDYVLAGYLKIHLDASMKLKGDPAGPLSREIAAMRSAELAQAAEEAHARRGFGEAPRYVIGTEVPIPGGARQKEDHVSVTRVSDVEATIEVSRQAFVEKGLESAWERVIALVVQPGVEFGDDFIQEYDQKGAADLSNFIEKESLVFEAHSTDYQTRECLRQMVGDHFAILKVGPALTFAYREAVFALAMMENELYPGGERSNLIKVLDQVMLEHPKHWAKYYPGDRRTKHFARKYSYSDRCRYYWLDPTIQAALRKLMRNLGKATIPLSLVSQYLPEQYKRIREGRLENKPQEIIWDKIRDVLDDYQSAIQP